MKNIFVQLRIYYSAIETDPSRNLNYASVYYIPLGGLVQCCDVESENLYGMP